MGVVLDLACVCEVDEVLSWPHGHVQTVKGQKVRMNQEYVVPTLATTSWTGSCSSDSPGHDVVMLTQ